MLHPGQALAEDLCVSENRLDVPVASFIDVSAFAMFVIIKAINAMKKKEAPPATAEPSIPSETELLIEIRDLLSKK